MKDINEIIAILLRNAKNFNLDYTNTTVRHDEGEYDVIIDIRVEKHRENPYNMINTIPHPNFDDILPKGDQGPL